MVRHWWRCISADTARGCWFFFLLMYSACMTADRIGFLLALWASSMTSQSEVNLWISYRDISNSAWTPSNASMLRWCANWCWATRMRYRRVCACTASGSSIDPSKHMQEEGSAATGMQYSLYIHPHTCMCMYVLRSGSWLKHIYMYMQTWTWT